MSSTSTSSISSRSTNGADAVRPLRSTQLTLPNIAVVGRMGSGKSTAAKHLRVMYNYYPIAFAAKLKRVAADIWGEEALTDREILQELGRLVRTIDEDAWIKALFRDLSPGLAPFVIDDCRFPNEYWYLRELGFVFIRVWAPEEVRVDRLMRNGKLQDRSQLYHISESYVDDFQVDHTIENTADEDDLRAELQAIVTAEARKR